MKREEIISLLDEAIAVLEELNGRALPPLQSEKFRIIFSMCTATHRGTHLLGTYAEDFHGCVGLACVKTFDRTVMQAMMTDLLGSFCDVTPRENVRPFLSALQEEIALHGLHSRPVFQRLATAGAASESFASVNL